MITLSVDLRRRRERLLEKMLDVCVDVTFIV
jgi:hypothetical protein